MLEILGKKRTIVLGHHDVLVGIKEEGNQGFMLLSHYPQGVGNTANNEVHMSDADMDKLPPLTNLRFDNVEGVDLLINQLQNLKDDMLMTQLANIMEEVSKQTVFPTKG